MPPEPQALTRDYLRRLLRQANLTQVEAAELIGVSPRTMKRYLGPRPDTIKQAGVMVLELAARRAGSGA